MAKVNLNKGQKTAVTEHGHPCFILAGAGTGKTFTLSQRVAFEFDEANAELMGGYGSLDPERLMAITFTEPAAAELTSRIRETAKGVSPEKAKRIEAAWISTIHAACRKMLVQSSFDADVDPGVVVLREDEEDAILDAAAEQVLNELQNKFLDKKVVKSLVRRSITIPGGTAAFYYGPPASPQPTARLYADALSLAHLAKDSLETGLASADDKSRPFLEIYLAEVEERIRLIDVFSSLGTSPVIASPHLKKKTRKRTAQPQEYCDFCDAMKDFGKDQARNGQLANLRQAVDETRRAFLSTLSDAGTVTFDSILMKTHQMLALPQVSVAFSESIDSLMVDEFQDTDPMQSQIVMALCSDGPSRPNGMDKLITVGDRQQSIYGFRGAELAVSDQMTESMSQANSKAEIKLDENYRSKEEILLFVEDVFSDDSMFGESFLKLVPGTDEQQCSGGVPRVQLAEILIEPGNFPVGSQPSADEVKQAEAELIATEIEKALEDGRIDGYDDVVILMRSLNRAQMYMEELSKRKIPSAITAGRKFYSFKEISCVVDVLDAVANPDDFRVMKALTHGMFFVPESELAEVKICMNTGASHGLSCSLWQLVPSTDANCPHFHAAMTVLHQTRQMLCQGEPIADVIGFLLDESGYKATLMSDLLQGEGKWANVRKLVDMAAGFEHADKTVGWRAIEELVAARDAAEGFDSRDNREKPGRMFGTGGKGCVSLMTIHASKGLEFPFVILASADSKGSSRTSVLTHVIDGEVFAALKNPSKDGSGQGQKGNPYNVSTPTHDAAELHDQGDYDNYASMVSANVEAAEKEEAKRLLYVALTRAKEHLFYAGICQKTVKGEVSFSKSDALFMKTRDIVLEKGELSDGVVNMGGYTVGYRTIVLEGKPERTTRAVSRRSPSHHMERPIYNKFRTQAKDKLSFSKLAGERTNMAEDYLSLPEDGIDEEATNEGADGAYKHGTLRRDAQVLGCAFHHLAELSIQNPALCNQDELFERVAIENKLDNNEIRRLSNIFSKWMSCQLREDILDGAKCIWTETPFSMLLELGCEDREMSGIIDLVVERKRTDGMHADIWDYKTGWEGAADDELEEHYRPQLMIYALAALSSGRYSQVNCAMIRMEPEVKAIGRLQYSLSDIGQLQEDVSSWVDERLSKQEE